MRVRADPVISLGRERAQFGFETVVFVEQFFGLIAQKPVFEQLHVLGLFHRDGHLMRAETVFDLKPVHDLRAGPALGGAEHDHRPEGAFRLAFFARVFLDLFDLVDALVERFRHFLVHIHGIVALDEIGLPAAAVEEALHLVVRDAGEHGRVVDLVAVQVQDRQHRAVVCGVKELIGVPCRRKRAGFRFAVAHGDRRNEVGVVEHRAERVRDGIAEFAAFVD